MTLDLHIESDSATADPPAHTLRFRAAGSLSRSAFGIDAYAPIVGDEIELRISGEARSEPPAQTGARGTARAVRACPHVSGSSGAGPAAAAGRPPAEVC